jgi:hypothetical protein
MPNGGRTPSRYGRRRRTGRSGIQQRIQHLHDHDQPIVGRPVVACGDAIHAKIGAQVLNGFLRLSAGNFQRMVSVASFAAAEAFADVGGDRLRGCAHLSRVQDPARRSVDQPIDLICRTLGSIQNIEVAMWHTAMVPQRSMSLAIDPVVASSFLCAAFPRRRRASSCVVVRRSSCAVRHLAPLGIWRRSAFRAVRHSAPFGISRL